MNVAYLNDQTLKDDMLTEMAEHRERDQLVQAFGYGAGTNDDFKGCAVGCAVHSLNRKRGTEIRYGDHEGLAKAIGFPVWLIHLVDVMFEALPSEAAKTWPERVLKAVNPGADLSRVNYQLQYWILAESGLLTINDTSRDAILQVAELNRRAYLGDEPTADEWSTAWIATAVTAVRAVTVIASVASVAAVAASKAARSAAFEKIADKTIELLSAA